MMSIDVARGEPGSSLAGADSSELRRAKGSRTDCVPTQSLRPTCAAQRSSCRASNGSMPRRRAGLRQEHATIRHLLADMGVRLEIHAVKEENVKRLIVALHTHAAREGTLLYKWADKLEPGLAESLLNKLSACVTFRSGGSGDMRTHANRSSSGPTGRASSSFDRQRPVRAGFPRFARS
jgi:hypothetical protein